MEEFIKFSQKSQMKLQAVGKMLGVNISNPSSVKGKCWFHVECAFHALLKPAGQDEQESSQYAATLQHMCHLSASFPLADAKGRAVNVIYFQRNVCFGLLSLFLTKFFQDIM